MNIWPEAKRWHPMPCYPNTSFQHREITQQYKLPLEEATFSHLHSGYIRKRRLIFWVFFLGQAMAKGSGQLWENAAFLSLYWQFCSADHGFEHDPELWAQQNTHSAAAFSTALWKGGREQASPTWLSFQLLNSLLPSPIPGFRFSYWSDLPNMVLTGMYNNESKRGSSFQGCLCAKKDVKT